MTQLPLVSKPDMHLIEKHSFCINSAGYFVANIKGKVQTLHSLILGKMDGKEIDHKNGNKLDNRRENLHFVTHQQNIWNMGLSKRNKSGIKGVSFDRRISKWVARISLNGKSIHLGSFSTSTEARRRRQLAEEQLFNKVKGNK